MDLDLHINVVICTRNRADKLRHVLDALGRQSAPPDLFDVVIVDNASTDDTRAVAAAHLQRHGSRWTYLRETKPGAAAARNAGIAASEGSILLFLDDDVIPEPELIEEHAKRHRTQSAIVLGLVRFPWNETGTAFQRTLWQHPELVQSFRFPNPEDVPFQYFYTCNVSLPRAFLAETGGFDETFHASGFEDTDLGFRLKRAGFRMVFNPRASGLHDCWQPFPAFAEKQRRNGRELRIFLQKYPELRGVFLPDDRRWRVWRPIARNLASFLSPWFEWRPGPLSCLALPLLSRLCWLDLQSSFRRGFEERT